MVEWKQYKDSIYEISNCGEVRNINTKKILKQHYKQNGKYDNDYKRISLKLNGKPKGMSVHRLVAEVFISNLENKEQVNHKNGIKYDNNVDNLEWCSREYNMEYAVKNGNGSEKKPVVCINIDTEEKLEFKSIWKGACYLKEKYNLKASKDSISHVIKNCCNGKSKTIHGCYWKFRS